MGENLRNAYALCTSSILGARTHGMIYIHHYITSGLFSLKCESRRLLCCFSGQPPTLRQLSLAVHAIGLDVLRDAWLFHSALLLFLLLRH
jgi:hypothetical protein